MREANRRRAGLSASRPRSPTCHPRFHHAGLSGARSPTASRQAAGTADPVRVRLQRDRRDPPDRAGRHLLTKPFRAEAKAVEGRSTALLRA